MKKLLFIVVLLLSCCCGEPLTDEQLQEVGLVRKFEVKYRHTENCKGHKIRFGKVDFQLDGHDMWYITDESQVDAGPFILHSPDCEKCKNEKEKPESIIESSVSDYWGW